MCREAFGDVAVDDEHVDCVGMISGLLFLDAQQCRNLPDLRPSHHCQPLWLSGRMTKVKVKQLTVSYLCIPSPTCDLAHIFQHCRAYLKKTAAKVAFSVKN